MALDTSVFHMSRALTQWLMPATDDRVTASGRGVESPCQRVSDTCDLTVSPLRLETSASSFTKHRVGATSVVLTVYVDIISCWSRLYGVYDGGGSKNMFVQ